MDHVDMQTLKFIYWQTRMRGSGIFRTILTTGRKGTALKTFRST
jgi:hypothetical protein